MQFCLSDIPHIAPSNEAEVRTFLWMDSKDAEENRHFCQQHGQVSAHTNTHTHTRAHTRASLTLYLCDLHKGEKNGGLVHGISTVCSHCRANE